MKYQVKMENHGMLNTRFYNIRVGMLTRCYNRKARHYYRYGGRGITICKDWKDSFLQFKKDMHESYLEHIAKHGEKNTQIERIDNLGEYSKANCHWATVAKQSRNRRTNVFIIIKDQRMILKDVAEYFGVKYLSLYHFYRTKKLSFKDALKYATPSSKDRL